MGGFVEGPGAIEGEGFSMEAGMSIYPYARCSLSLKYGGEQSM